MACCRGAEGRGTDCIVESWKEPIKEENCVDDLSELARSIYDGHRSYRVVTFQSKEVVDILLSGKDYYACEELMREGSLCSEDIALCNGQVPIWVFQHPAFKGTKIGPRQWSDMLQTFRCEMSVNTLDGFYMIELTLQEQPPVGKAHNASSLACVIPCIKTEWVRGIYEINSTSHWYLYAVVPIKIFAEDILFSKKHVFTKEEYKDDLAETIRLLDYESVGDYYKDRRKSHG